MFCLKSVFSSIIITGSKFELNIQIQQCMYKFEKCWSYEVDLRLNMSVTFRVGELFPNFDSLMSKIELPSSAGSLKVSCLKTLHDEGRCLNHCS